MNIVARSVNSLVRRYSRQPDHAISAQEAAIANALKRSKDSIIAREIGFADCDSLDGFMATVPALQYPDLKPYWDRAGNGERDVIGNEEVVHFAMTAGTTGNRKLVPLTPSLLKRTRRQFLHAMSTYLRKNPDSSVLFKSGLAITGRSRITETAGGIPCGMISGVSFERTLPIIRRRSVPSMKTLNLEDWDQKLESMAREASRRSIGYLAGIPGSIVSFFEKARDVLPTSEYEPMCSGIEVIFVSGVNYLPYKSVLASLIGHEPEFVNVYMASEGMMGCQTPENPTEFELFTREMVFGFVPLEESSKGDYSRRLSIDKLVSGEEYSVLLTNGSGAFNYVIGDVLRCTAIGQVPRFELAGRTVLTLDIVAEKTSITAVERAMADVAQSLGLPFGEFLVTANTGGARPHYEWVIEDTGGWSEIDSQELTRLLDDQLCAQNKNYEYFLRVQPQLNPARVVVVTRSIFHDWLAARGGEQGHKKVPRIVPERARVAELVGDSKSSIR